MADANLVVYAVWEPILRTDDERSARKATALLPDARVVNYWTDGTELGEAFQPAIHLTTEPAWDVYLVYPPGVVWEAGEPPAPEFFMHQLGGRLPHAQGLDGAGLAQEIRRHLSEPHRSQ
ncbi:MAG: hypothetical protein ACT4PE_10790 [Candidatus Eiseniibacteriota bacterium]